MLLWDGYGLQSTHSGIGRHALELAQNLTALGTPPHILPSVPQLDFTFQPWTVPLKPFSMGRIKPLALFAAGRMAKRFVKGDDGPHVFHGLSNYNIPALSPAFQRVLTIHDLIPFMAPDAVSKALRTYMVLQLPRAILKADHIICVSQWTADSVLDLFPGAKGKISVILNGKPPLASSAVKAGEKDTINLFTLSRDETYKRLHLIPEILKKLPENYEWHVLTQGSGLDLLQNIPRLHLHTAIADAALEQLWKNTDIFVHPSLWEGYCLPAASALSLGIPSVYTGGSGIDEVVGSAGIRLAASEGAAPWASAIEGVGNSLTQWPSRCAKQWQRLPTWAEVAGQTQKVYATLSASLDTSKESVR
ncbi:MAG: glycosyltransferase [Chitinophagaceae bacterium]|nr:glycosyltransferase [Oligoflexus sp.]